MTSQTIKRTVQFLLIDGSASGRIQARLDNWTGVAYRIPRLMLAASKDREDLRYCGIYFLFGEDENAGEDVVYIGQTSERKNGDSLLARCAEHARDEGKSFFNEVVFFTTTTDDFGPTELCYLENRFWKLSHDAKRFRIKNGNEPSVGNVTEAKQAELDRFIENAKILMNTLGYRLFEPIVPASSEIERKNVAFYMERNTRTGTHVKAEGLWTNDGFVVRKGSELIQKEKHGLLKSAKERRKQLEADGVTELVREGVLLLNEDQLFSSPTAAAVFVTGCPCNGRTTWKTEDGKTFADIEAELEL